MPSSPSHDAAGAVDAEERRDLRRLLLTTVVLAVAVVAAVTLLSGSALWTESSDWRVLLAFWWHLLVVPPAVSIALAGVAAMLGLCADRLPPRRGRWTRRAALALGHLALFVVALEVALTVGLLLLGLSG